MDANTVEAPTVKAIVAEYLKAHGYDGLYDDDCGCLLGDDFMPCGLERIDGCLPGYKQAPDCCGDCASGVAPKREGAGDE